MKILIDDISEKLISSFREKVEKLGNESGCWLWTGCTDEDGYGKISFPRKIGLAHRAAYVLAFGELDSSRMVLHKCDTPSCVNPSHLFLGDQLANMKDMVQKGRAARGEGSPVRKLSEEDVFKIREMFAKGFSGPQIGKIFGVSPQNVVHIVLRKGWKHLPPRESEEYDKTKSRAPKGEHHGRSKLSSENVLEIRRRCEMGEKKGNIASDFKVGERLIRDISARRIWRHIT